MDIWYPLLLCDDPSAVIGSWHLADHFGVHYGGGIVDCQLQEVVAGIDFAIAIRLSRWGCQR